ncbi:GNAT family N-acetyltransferase [Mesorhizobium sp. WSM4307]|uniref:acyl-homoserine-lactone synthase n=1 Tax=unclassified Mesorhizobium TaxID=325217 RepID=UPI00115E9E74|nr:MULTISPECIES: acyl-homoserine-lactone synthase [unclassified Mesorhizobium]TRC75243.1 GNAT family N-acetyltransferase [Mesorhizobium sp. WSM4310]TRC77948.1 GNAT family N-acetyltransferase [Mesorhizobium sp. WSM4315]TRC78656.1 GNAT family N-acetyltransferase [Mesorhizobium sp. WSM4307]
MVRIHLVTWSNRKHYRKLLERYFRIRYDIYVRQRQWRAVARPINIEIDAFDNEHALYLLALDTNGKIVGGSRLVPTLEPHLMSEVFPGLAGGTPPRAAEIFEWTRFFVIPSLRTQGASSPVAGVVLCGLLEAALRLGIRQISVVCEAFWPKRLRALGWTLTELGEVLEHPDGDIVALLIDVTLQAIQATRRAYSISGAILADEA